MKSHNTYTKNKGMMVVEAVIALAASAFIMSLAVLTSLSNQDFLVSTGELAEHLVALITTVPAYATDHYEYIETKNVPTAVRNNILFTSFQSSKRDNLKEGVCSPSIDIESVPMMQSYSLGAIGDSATDVMVKGTQLMVSLDDGNAPNPDLKTYLFDSKGTLQLISALNTGPGIVALAYHGDYVYGARAGTSQQIQVIDIKDPTRPSLLAQFKVPLPYATATPPFVRTLAYKDGYLFVGTERWEGSEFLIIDAIDPMNLHVTGEYEIGSIINSMYIEEGKAYLATGNRTQLQVLDVSDVSNVRELVGKELSGWQTQEGRVVKGGGNHVVVGRTVGGFNNPSNHELFLISSDSNLSVIKSVDIGKSIYDMVVTPTLLLIANSGGAQKFQVYDVSTLELVAAPVSSLSIVGTPQSMWCDDRTVYITTRFPSYIYAITFNNLL